MLVLGEGGGIDVVSRYMLDIYYIVYSSFFFLLIIILGISLWFNLVNAIWGKLVGGI